MNMEPVKGLLLRPTHRDTAVLPLTTHSEYGEGPLKIARIQPEFPQRWGPKAEALLSYRAGHDRPAGHRASEKVWRQ